MPAILVIGDARHAPALEGSPLARRGVDVRYEASLDLALELLRSEGAGLVVLDPHPVAADLAPVVARLREASPGIPVLLLATPGEQERLDASIGDGFISRPITVARLVDAARRHLAWAERDEGRVDVALAVEFRSGPLEGNGFTRDLSPEGMFLATRDPLEAGSRIDVAFTLPIPGAPRVTAKGEVVRVEVETAPFGAGVRFTSIGAADRAEIVRWSRGRGAA
jgi:uncharacterized protein (TIGR02266 family)